MSARSGVRVGVVGGGRPATVDEFGSVHPAGASWHLEWWIGADDRWRLPTNEVAVRQTRVGDAPVVETAMRVPGGDAVARVYGVGGPGRPLVVEVENASPAPFVLALVVRGASRVSADGPVALVDRAFVLRSPRAPSRWASTVGSPVQMPVTTGRAGTGPVPTARDRAGRIEAAFLHPVAHRTVLRSSLTRSADAPDLDPRTLPDASSVVAGWHRTLDRAMRVEVPDAALVSRIDAARAEVLLAGQEQSVTAATVAALEDWGFDTEAAEGWRFLPARVRRRAATRAPAGAWVDALAAPDAEFLLAVKRLLVDDRPGDEPVALLRGWREAWRGQSIAIREAPTARGPVSVALRWHGPRAALLWDAPPGTVLTAPTLDPDWSADVPSGEALLDVRPGAD